MPDPGLQPPAAAPMAAPAPQKGNREQALMKVRMAAKVLASAVDSLGFDTPEGKAAIKILGDFAKHFGKTEDGANELVPEEAKQMAQIAGPQGAPGGGPPGAPPGMPPQGGMGPRVPGVGQLPGM